MLNRISRTAGMIACSAVTLFLSSSIWAEESRQIPESGPVSTSSRPAGTPSVDAAVFMVGDSSVQGDLRCSEDQKRQIRRLLDEIDQPFWALRDLKPEQSSDKLQPLVARVETGLKTILKPAQQRRLEQIVLQYRGPAALVRPEMVKALALTDKQVEQLRAVLWDTRRSLGKLADSGAPGKDPEAKNKEATQLLSREQEMILVVLTDQQKQRWVGTRGKRFDLAKVQPLPIRAPELQAANTWINSEPLTLAKLRGQVVVVHFWTFGCGNCIHNYPHYKAWQRDYAAKGLTIIGIHTPETQGEHSLESLRKKVKDNGLEFPIVVDNDRKNWTAWTNRIWPSVYLIDKQGYIRYWWYGELNWQGAQGEAFMRRKIGELLASPGTP